MSERRCIVDGKTRLEIGEPQTCLNCLSVTRSALMEIVELYALLPGELVDHAGAASPPNGGTRSGNDGLPDALVLLGPGSDATNQVRDIIHDRDASHAADELASHPPSVVGELGRWEDDWRIVQREQGMRVAVPQTPATVSGSASYLLDSMTWAGQRHPAFNEFAADMRALRERLRHATRTAPVVERGVPCPYCQAALIRGQADPTPCRHPGPHRENCDQGGRLDQWRCPDRECERTTFTEREYVLAVWSNWDDLRGDVDSHREHLRGHEGTGDGMVFRLKVG